MKSWIKIFLPPLVSLLTSFSCPAEAPGRLFFTPEQRRQLDRSGTLEAEPVADERNDGFLQTPDGRRIQWIDGQAQTDRQLEHGVGDTRLSPLLPPGSLQIVAPELRR